MVKVSVVVPIYNVEKYISQMIESLLQQTLNEIEIILVDDGSPDKSGEICDQYAKNDKRIKVIHKKNGGVSAARNDGLAIATGEYIIFCDSDDWLPLEALQKLYDAGKETDADVVIGDVYMFEKNKPRLVHVFGKPFVTEDRNFIMRIIQADFYRSYCPLPPKGGPVFGYGAPWNKIVKTELLKNNKIQFDTRLKGVYDDIIYVAYVLANAKKIAYISTPVYYWRILSTSITHTYKSNAFDINNAIFNSWKEFISRYDSQGMFIKPFYASIIRRFVDIIPIYFLSLKNPKKFSVRMKEMKMLILEPLYQEAIHGVEPSKLTFFQRQIWILMKIKFSYGICAIYKLKQLVKSII